MPRAVFPARVAPSSLGSDAFALDAVQADCSSVNHLRARSKSRLLLSEYSLISIVVETIPVL